MSKQTVVQKFDDLTGKEFDKGETIPFTFDGKSYEIDLNALNARNFRRSMAKYLDKARPVKETRASRHKGAQRARRGDVAQVREWAASHGFEVKTRGRIPAEIMEAYEKANS